MTTHITYDQAMGQYNMEALYYKGRQKEKGLEHINDVIRIMDSLHIRHSSTSATTREDQKWNPYNVNNVLVGTMALAYSPSFRIYEVTLTIYGKRATN